MVDITVETETDEYDVLDEVKGLTLGALLALGTSTGFIVPLALMDMQDPVNSILWAFTAIGLSICVAAIQFTRVAIKILQNQGTIADELGVDLDD